YNYLQRTQSITNSRSGKHVADLFRALEFLRSFLLERRIYETHRVAFDKWIKNCVGYLLHHMQRTNLSEPEFTKKLVRICRWIGDEYLADNTVIQRISPERLQQLIEAGLTVDLNRSDSEFRSAISEMWKDGCANE